DLVGNVSKMLNVNLFDYSNSKTFGNKFVKVQKTFSNTYKIKPNKGFDEVINDIIKNGKDTLSDILGGLKPEPEPEPEPDPPKKDFIFPLHKPYRITQEFKGTA